MASRDGELDLTATGGGASLRGAREYLLCIAGERAWTVALPAAGELVIGRGVETGLPLDDALVSRQHAQLLAVPDGLRLSDLGSRHGTLVNGERLVGPRLVHAGDVVTIGATTLVVQRPLDPAVAGVVVDATGFARRVGDELARALAAPRELAIAVLRTASPIDRPHAAAILAGRLRRMDAAAPLAAHELAVLLPELDDDEAADVAAELARALEPGAPAAVGIAIAPADGVDSDTLLACARAAAASAGPGGVVRARDTVHVVEIGPHRVVVADPGMLRLYELAQRLARSSLPVLVLGETGAGKELAAAAIHAASARAGGPFVSINCAAIPEGLAESELFGHARGAFTGALVARPGQLEVASGGTLFLDEIGELAPAVQAKLLRVLETGMLTRVGETTARSVDLRVVAATHRDLEAEIVAGRFRRDLYFRLGAARLELPPLRDRPRDLAAVAPRFVADACARLGRSPLTLSVGAAQALFAHAWPGNVRELRHALEYAAAAAPDDACELELWHLPASVTAPASRGAPPPATRPPSAPAPVPPPSPGFRADGLVSAMAEGRTVASVRLHGAVAALARDGDRVVARSVTGTTASFPIGGLDADRCAVVRRIWRDVPAVWREGQVTPTPPPAGHRCR